MMGSSFNFLGLELAGSFVMLCKCFVVGGGFSIGHHKMDYCYVQLFCPAYFLLLLILKVKIMSLWSLCFSHSKV
jgi:hypothetical protein